jgi:alanine racemase
MRGMPRSEITIDLSALRRNARRLADVLGRAELWAVVKADAYGHGALDAARAALDGGARALCVATAREGLSLRDAFPRARILVMGPTHADEIARVQEAGLELAVSSNEIPEGVRVHLKLDTGMGRFGAVELPEPGPNVVGLMSHLATADSDPAFAERQLDRFRDIAAAYPALEAHIANSAGALRFPSAHFDAARCGIALYGLSPFGGDPADDGLEPVLSWRSELAHVRQLPSGASTGYGRTFVAEQATWIGLVPVGYADGFRRHLTGTEVLVDGERRRVVGTVSMDSFAVELDRGLPVGTPVVLIGHGVLAESHARVADTINWELASRIESGPARATRVVV